MREKKPKTLLNSFFGIRAFLSKHIYLYGELLSENSQPMKNLLFLAKNCLFDFCCSNMQVLDTIENIFNKGKFETYVLISLEAIVGI